MRMSAYDTYSMFIALKNHFTQSNYDFVKYNGKTNTSKDAFQSRKDRFQFQKLCRKYKPEEMKDFIISNMIKGKNWVGDFLDDDAHQNFVDYTKRKQAFTYTFANELNTMMNEVNNPKDLFKIKDQQYPKILSDYFTGKISLETLAVLNKYVKFSDAFDLKLGEDDVMWSKIRLLIQKVLPFVIYDDAKIRKTLKEMLNIKEK